jgi:hypothetical protein
MRSWVRFSVSPGRRSVVAACALAAALACSSCNNTPTLPLPPPIAQATLGESGLALVKGDVNPLAYVSVLNERTEAGVITRADHDGHFEASLEAEAGDLLTIWQELGGELSEQKQTTVQRPR